MKLLGRIFLAFGAFLVVAGVLYGLHSREYQGLTLMLTTAGGAFLFGGYLTQALQRATAIQAAEAAPAAEGEPHVGPTIWPLVFALSMVPLVVGALGSRWVLAVGGVVFVVAGVGWLLDVQRQWQAHYGGGHGPATHGADASVDG
ncbi:MAG TPA: cytochrome c oxidase subunit 4 [Nocardioides sp.]|nr:cytochrome c oxidase subunit 4 [Nocardioides sp.]